MEQEQKKISSNNKIDTYIVKWAIMDDSKLRSTNAHLTNNDTCTCDPFIKKINKTKQEVLYQNRNNEQTKDCPVCHCLFTKKINQKK